MTNKLYAVAMVDMDIVDVVFGYEAEMRNAFTDMADGYDHTDLYMSKSVFDSDTIEYVFPVFEEYAHTSDKVEYLLENFTFVDQYMAENDNETEDDE